jgi:hypothetical protein
MALAMTERFSIAALLRIFTGALQSLLLSLYASARDVVESLSLRARFLLGRKKAPLCKGGPAQQRSYNI